MKIKFALFSAIAMLFAVACEGPEEPNTPNTPEVLVSLTPTSMEFTSEGGEQTVTLTAKEDWTAKASAKWIVLTTLSGSAGDDIAVEILAEKNEALEPREGKVTFTVGDQKAELAVTQEAAVEDNGGEDENGTLDFFINPEGGYAGYSSNPVLLDSSYAPGHKLTLVADSDAAVITLVDYDYAQAGCSSYSYLTTHNYPPVAGDKTTAPTTSGYVVDKNLTYFSIDRVIYYPIIPESPTDEEGNPYGFYLMWTAMPNSDINVYEMRIPVEDKNGNRKVIVGGGSHTFDYEFQPEPSNFMLGAFGFTNYEYTVDANNVVTMESNSFSNGTFTIKVTTADGSFISGEGAQYSVADGTLAGTFFESFSGVTYTFDSGSLAIVARDGENAYALSVKEDVVFSAPGYSVSYKLAVGDHNVTISPKANE